MSTTWIVVADVCKARIFSGHKGNLFKGDASKLIEMSHLENPDGRKKDIDLTSDKQGKFGSGTFQEQTDPKHHEEDVFAHEIAKHLTKAHNENQYQDLILVALPNFIGMLTKHLHDGVKKVVSLKIEKDYMHCTTQELVNHMQPYL